MKKIVLSLATLSTFTWAVVPYVLPEVQQNGSKFDAKANQYDNNRQNLTYSWSFLNMNNNKTINSTGEVTTVPLTEIGFYKVSVTAKNNLGESVTKLTYKNVTKLDTPKALAPIASMNVTVNGTTINILSTSQNATNTTIYVKKDGAYFSYESVSSKQITNATPGKYWIEVTAINKDGISTKISQTVEVVTPQVTTPTYKADYTLGTPTKVVGSTNVGYSTYLTKLGAQTAWAQGWTGTGVNVAVIDTGVNKYSEFENRLLAGADFSGKGVTTDDVGHGTFVAGVIAAANDDKMITGVAFDANIIPVKAFSGSTGSFNSIVNSINYVNSRNDVNIANISLGGKYLSATEVEAAKTTIINASKNNKSFILAAGNDGLACQPVNGSLNGQCNMVAALPSLTGFDALSNSDGAWIVVGSVNSNNVLSTFSNKAGVTKDYYMVAYGENIVGYYGKSYIYGNGTSFAAPQVTGAFALLQQKYPYLKGREIQDILMQTATDLGAAGVDDVYGHGLLNITKAMQPIGELKLVSSRNVNTKDIAKYSLNSSTISGTTASANMLKSLSATLSSVATFDDYNRAYTVNMSSNVNTKTYAGFDFNNFEMLTPDNKLLIGVDEYEQSIALGWRFNENVAIMFGQDDKYIGLEGKGGLGIDNGQTNYVGVILDKSIDSIDLHAAATYGRSSGKPVEGGLFSKTDTANLVGYEATVGYNGFSIGAKREMMPISGSVDVIVPESRTMDGDVVATTKSIDLKTGLADEIKMVAKYETKLTTNTSFDITHLAGNEDQITKARFTYKF